MKKIISIFTLLIAAVTFSLNARDYKFNISQHDAQGGYMAMVLKYDGTSVIVNNYLIIMGNSMSETPVNQKVDKIYIKGDEIFFANRDGETIASVSCDSQGKARAINYIKKTTSGKMTDGLTQKHSDKPVDPGFLKEFNALAATLTTSQSGQPSSSNNGTTGSNFKVNRVEPIQVYSGNAKDRKHVRFYYDADFKPYFYMYLRNKKNQNWIQNSFNVKNQPERSFFHSTWDSAPEGNDKMMTLHFDLDRLYNTDFPVEFEVWLFVLNPKVSGKWVDKIKLAECSYDGKTFRMLK